MPGRVRQFMNRYGGIFAKDPEPTVRRVPPRPISEVEMVASFYREALAPIASAPVVHQPVDDEIVLLESASPTAAPTAASTATPTATPGDSARRADNGITFIE